MPGYYFLFAFLLLFNFYDIYSMGDDNFKKPWENDLKIPKDIRPISYDVFLHPDMEKGIFTGEVKVLVNLTASRDWIPIHVKSTTVYETLVFNSHGQRVEVKEAFGYPKHEFWVINLPKIDSGLYKIELKFNGSLTQSIVGFYRSVYTENNKSR